MRFSHHFVCVIVLLTAASAAGLKIKVVDPQSAAVAGAVVQLYENNTATLLAVSRTSAEGLVIFQGTDFQGKDAGSFQVRVLAPGFAEQTQHIASANADLVTVPLRLAAAAETVLVTATRSPVPSEEATTSEASLSGAQLQVMRPIAASDALRFLPGAVVNNAGQRGGLSSLFVRGGDSRYNKVIFDGVTINDPGGTFDFGVLPLEQSDRLEFVRGAQSTLYGSDAMTSVVQVWTRTGSTRTPELTFGADGGNINTASGYAAVAGARGVFDYNVFADQFNTEGQGPNDDYSNSLQGGNVGVEFNDRVALRLRVRHSNAYTGVPSFWNFNGQAVIPPDLDQYAHQNNFMAGLELTIAGPSRWQHRFTGFDYTHRRDNVDNISDPGRVSPVFGNIDFPFHNQADINRAGFEYQGDYTERSWAHTTFGYRFEDENGFINDLTTPSYAHGLYLNQDVYGQQMLTLKRLTVIAGARFLHNTVFGNDVVPRVALSLQALKGGDTFSGTRLYFSYATGIKEPRLEETFAAGPFSIPNPNLKAEENRAFDAGILQSLFGGAYSFRATYFNNLFHNQINYASDPISFIGQYVNVDKARADGAELEFQGTIRHRIMLDAAYVYTSTKILESPFAFDPLLEPGQPLLRRPKNSGSLLLSYLGHKWGGNLSGSFVGSRPDSDFLGFGVTHAAGYALVNVGGWYAITSRITAYVNIDNLLNKQYEEVAGYPALSINFRAGMRFRIGGE